MMTLMKMSLSAALFILVIVIVRAFIMHRLPKATLLLLWAAALIRLLIPFSISSPLSAYNTFSSVAPLLGDPIAQIDAILPDTRLKEPSSTEKPGESAIEKTGPTAGRLGTEAADLPEQMSPAQTFSLPRLVLMSVWLAGFLLLGGFFLTNHLRCRKEYLTALPLDHEAAARWLAEHRLYRQVRLCQSDRILSPLTYGLFSPVILLPRAMDLSDGNHLAYVLTHELVHIQRKDILIKGLLAMALCIHWFNPLVWILYFLANRDLELACDEIVVRLFGQPVKSAYAMMLIGLEEKRAQLMPLGSSFSRNAIEERITAVMKIKTVTRGSKVLSLLLVAIITLAFATSAVASSTGPSEAAESTASSIVLPEVFRGALGEKETRYAAFVNTPSGTQAQAAATAASWRLDSTLFTDLDVYVLLAMTGDISELPDVSGRIAGVGEYADETLYGLAGDLQELKPGDDGVRYFLYTATLAKADQVQPKNEQEQMLVLAAGEQWRYYTSLTEYEGSVLELTVNVANETCRLSSAVEQVCSQVRTFTLDPDRHGGEFYDTISINPYLIELSGTSQRSEDELMNDQFWYLPGIEIYLELDDGTNIFAGRWTKEHANSSEDETPGYKLHGGSAGGDEKTGEFHLTQNLRDWNLDTARISALLINGVRYPATP